MAEYWHDNPPTVAETARLTEYERRVVETRFGLGGAGRKTLAETAEITHVGTRKQVRAIERRALGKICYQRTSES